MDNVGSISGMTGGTAIAVIALTCAVARQDSIDTRQLRQDLIDAFDLLARNVPDLRELEVVKDQMLHAIDLSE